MARPNGQIRRGQIINVFGPGAAPTESAVSLVCFVETSRAVSESLRSVRYFAIHSKERAVKNIVLGLFLLPTIFASRVSKFTSSRSSLSASEIRIPVAISISTKARKQ